MLRLTSVALTLILVLGACGRYKEEKWPERSAKISCKTARRCDSANFWFHYESLGACIDDTVAASEGLYDGCTYDKKAARRCTRAMKWSCRDIGERYDELQERCAAVWSCPTGDTGADTGLVPL